MSNFILDIILGVVFLLLFFVLIRIVFWIFAKILIFLSYILTSLANLLLGKNKTPSSNTASSSTAKSSSNSPRLAFMIFIGSLLGSLIGVAADLNDAKEAVFEIYTLFNPSPQLNIAGSNTILGERLHMAEDWKNNFMKQTAWEERLPVIGNMARNIKIDIQGVGSHKGIQAAKEGKVHLLAMSDPMSEEEEKLLAKRGIKIRCAAEIGYDAIIFVTDLNNDIPAFSKYAITSILKGIFVNWSQISDFSENKNNIRVLARRGSGTTHVILKQFLDDDKFPDHFIECRSNAQCLDQALSVPGSIYWVSAVWLYTQPKDYIHPLLIRRNDTLPAQNPFIKNFNLNNYPYEMVRGLYMYVLDGKDVDSKSSDLAKKFLLYVRGVRGQQILEKYHFFTYFKSPNEVDVTLPKGFGGQKDKGSVPVVCRW